ncbi:MAG: vWA domain-containing protein, partial [Nanobdellota archaeon]
MEGTSFDINFLADDAIDVLSEIRISEIDDAFIQTLISNNNLTAHDMNNSVLEQALIFWAEGKPELARGLLNATLVPELKGKYRFGFFAGENSTLFNDSIVDINSLMVYKKFVSGIEEGKQTRGFMTKVSFTDIHSKQTNLYHYFGGFVGQGNVTANMSLVNLTGARIISMELELDVVSDFVLYINDDLVGIFTHSAGHKEADRWTINQSTTPSIDDSWFVDGDNLVTLDFVGQMNESYIGGGYIKITYETNTKKDPYTRFTSGNAIRRIPLSGVSGAINIYDSFYVPGDIHGMKVYLDYVAQHNTSNSTNSSLFFNLGNKTVYRSSNFTDPHRTASLTNFTQLNLSELGFNTIPYRVGYSNLSYVVSSSNHSGAGDAILVTDRSGSMQWVFYENNNNGKYRSTDYSQCTDTRLNDPEVSRIYVARCVDKEFAADMVGSSPYNRVGLTSYSTNLLSQQMLNDDYPSLKQQIEQYDAGGGTCTACGVWRGVQGLLQSSNSISARL